MAELLGFKLVEVEPGHAVFEVVPGEQHYNPIGVVHGGLAMTLLDSAMGCAVQTQMPAGSAYATVEAKTNLIRAITSQTGTLRAIGKVLHCGGKALRAREHDLHRAKRTLAAFPAIAAGGRGIVRVLPDDRWTPASRSAADP